MQHTSEKSSDVVPPSLDGPPSLDTAETITERNRLKMLGLLEDCYPHSHGLEEKININRTWKNVHDCRKAYQRFTCTCCEKTVDVLYHCHFRFCYSCSRDRQAFLKERYSEFIDAMAHPIFITLTLQNYDAGYLQDMIDDLLQYFSRLRQRDIWKPIAGGIRSLEITWNKKTETWHAHLHILADMPRGLRDLKTRQFRIPQYALSDEWSEITGGSSIVWISKANKNSIHEVLKYISKIGDYFSDPLAFTELMWATYRRRLIQPFGSWFGASLSDPDKDRESVCPDCGGPLDFLEYIDRTSGFREVTNCEWLTLDGKPESTSKDLSRANAPVQLSFVF